MVGRAVAAANVVSIANLLYSMFATVKTWMLYPCFFLVGGYGEYSTFNQIVFIMFCASKIRNGYGRQSPKDAEGRGR